HTAAGRADRAIGRTPAHHEHARFAGGVVDREVVNVDAVDLGAAQSYHRVVVLRGVGDVPLAVLFLQTADAVFEACGAGNRPLACECLLISYVGPEFVGTVLGVGLRGEGDP